MSYIDMLHVFIGICIGFLAGLCGGVAFVVMGCLRK